MDELMKQLGFSNLKYSDLTPDEKVTFEQKLSLLEKNVLTIEREREFIAHMRFLVEQELTKPHLSHDEDLYLKARLKNLMLLESFLMTPERAKAELQRNLSVVEALPKR